MSQLPAAAHEREIPTSLPPEFADTGGSLAIFGFWVFLGSDIVLFSCLFTAYIVYRPQVAGGPDPLALFRYGPALLETLILLTSSFCCGLAIHAMRERRRGALMTWLGVTLALGLSFVLLELREFVHDVHTGASWHRSAFLSAFFTLVGAHGAHVSFGLLWGLAILVQLARQGLNARSASRMYTFSLYWHFLDIIWVFIFTVVYLMRRIP